MSDPLYVEAPPLKLTNEQAREFERQWERLKTGEEYRSGRPKHEFLRWLVQTQPVLLHGSNNPAVDVFEPRDQRDFDDTPIHAVFATHDGLWPIYFAIANRRFVRSLINDCVHENGGLARYFFSLGTEPIDADPWTTGTVYVLPRDGFSAGRTGVEWTCPKPVVPLARVPIDPDEFPLLDDVHRHHPRESISELEARLRGPA